MEFIFEIMKKSEKYDTPNLLNKFRVYNSRAPSSEQFPFHKKHSLKSPNQSQSPAKDIVELYFVNPNILFMHEQSHKIYQQNLRVKSAADCLLKMKVQANSRENSRMKTCQSYNRRLTVKNSRNLDEESERIENVRRAHNKMNRSLYSKKLETYLKMEEAFSSFRRTGYLKKKNRTK